jgi:Cof subfamily protein (haloacid dehalogenase superfamily)
LVKHRRETSASCASTATREAKAIRTDLSISLEAAPPINDGAPAAPRAERSRRIDLVAIDLDGTLLRTDKKLSKKVSESVREAAAKGVHIVLATARPPRAVRTIYRHLGLESPQINYNGALIHDEHRGRTLFHQPLPVKLGERIVQYARKIDPAVVVSIETLDKWYTDHVDDSLPTETSKSFSPDFVGPLEAFLHKPATKIMFLAPPDRMGKVHSAIKAKFGKKVTIIVCDAHLIQVIHPSADKQTALERVAADHGVARENVMAIGDAPNDERMIRWAGLGVAMENAWPQVRAAAHAIVPSNDEHGVAVALRRYVL